VKPHTVAAAFAVLVATLVTPSALATPGPPLSIAALGGAGNAGTCTDRSCADRHQNSWSTGTNQVVVSHRLRMRKLADGIRCCARFRRPIRAYTLASSRYRTIADLEAQVREAVSRPWRYATVDLGVGDVCSGMSLGRFRAELTRALTVLVEPAQFEVDGLDPQVGREVLVPSIEDLAGHWRVLRADRASARALRAGRHLDCGLGYSVAHARLAQIRRRTIALNDAIARACFRLGCLYDAGTRFRMPLRASYFSRFDPRYLSIEGQRALAAAEWKPAFALIVAGS
jgi:hypothetical protein